MCYCGSVSLNYNPHKQAQKHNIILLCEAYRARGSVEQTRVSLLTNHVLPDVCHSVELLLADFARELLLCVAMHDLDVLVQRPQLLKRLVAGDALQEINKVEGKIKKKRGLRFFLIVIV